MSEDPLFIDDGYTKQHTIAGVEGLHPAVAVVYRPALDRERRAYDAKIATRDPDQVERYESDLIARQVVELNGKPAAEWKAKLNRLHPAVRATLINLVLSYTPAKWAEVSGESGGVQGS